MFQIAAIAKVADKLATAKVQQYDAVACDSVTWKKIRSGFLKLIFGKNPTWKFTENS